MPPVEYYCKSCGQRIGYRKSLDQRQRAEEAEIKQTTERMGFGLGIALPWIAVLVAPDRDAATMGVLGAVLIWPAFAAARAAFTQRPLSVIRAKYDRLRRIDDE